MATSDLTPDLLRGLVDDAGLFPPEQLDMPAAVARHRADRLAGSRVLTHRFVCPVGRLDELREQLVLADRIELIALGPATQESRVAIASVLRDSRIVLRGFETVMPTGGADRVEALAVADAIATRVPGLEVSFEVGLAPLRAADLDLLTVHGHRAKIRCGGVRRELFPAATDLAVFLLAAAERRLRFKATAGLHHAVSHTDPETGFDHYGFLNLLAATRRAEAGASVAEVEAVLLERDPDRVVAAARGGVRGLFCSFGSCSTREPLDDLAALGLLPAPALRR